MEEGRQKWKMGSNRLIVDTGFVWLAALGYEAVSFLGAELGPPSSYVGALTPHVYLEMQPIRK